MARSSVTRSLRVGAVLLGALTVMGFRMAFAPEAAEPASSTSGTRPVVTPPTPRTEPRAVSVTASVGAASTPVPEQGPGSLPPRTVHPRDPNEWQGMPVELSMRASCGEALHCGLAAACTDGLCGPCARDNDCASGEACVLDHCVPQQQVECRARRDCPSEQLCVLTGYSSDPRGNTDMRARCLDPQGGTVRPAEPLRSEPADTSRSPEPLVYEELQRRLGASAP